MTDQSASGRCVYNSYDFQDDVLVIDFSAQYHEMSRAREVLTRAGIVKTFLQVPDIHRVRFTVEGQELTDSRNNKIGDMTEESFLELSGKDTDYRYDTFTLYFADKSGKKLVKEEKIFITGVPFQKKEWCWNSLPRVPWRKGIMR